MDIFAQNVLVIFSGNVNITLNINKSFCWNSDIRPFPHNLLQSLTDQIKDPKLHESEHDHKNKFECSQWSSNTCNNL